MKSILSAAVLLISSVSLATAGDPKNHAEVCEGVVKEMVGMMTDMSKITDVPSAEAFAKKMPACKANMKALLKVAQALPAPTDAEKAAFEKRMEEEEEKAAPALMQMMMGLAQNPDAEAIGKVLQGVMEDEEMEEVVETMEAIYKVEEKEGAAEAPAPKIE